MHSASHLQPFKYIISVRALCALTAKTGDLDLSFTPSPTAPGHFVPVAESQPGQNLDKIFFLTAKTSGRRLSLDALNVINTRNVNLPLRVLELSAREKTCEHPDKSCYGESCPLAKGFYDRLPQARQQALRQGTIDKAALRETALKNQVCPYYLAQGLANWSDVVVGDYNYYFDLHALLYTGTVINEWRVSLLVDEAHNMVERARSMYSAELDQAAFDAVCWFAPKPLKAALTNIPQGM